jgi:hypothetical protein
MMMKMQYLRKGEVVCGKTYVLREPHILDVEMQK